jgi:hypothetical protein
MNLKEIVKVQQPLSTNVADAPWLIYDRGKKKAEQRAAALVDPAEPARPFSTPSLRPKRKLRWFLEKKPSRCSMWAARALSPARRLTGLRRPPVGYSLLRGEWSGPLSGAVYVFRARRSDRVN